MNARSKHPLADIQAQVDSRGLAIDAAGIRALRYPVTLAAAGAPVSTVATFSMSVALEPGTRGTHMSRFIELLEAQDRPLDVRGFMRMFARMLDRLGATSGNLAMRFPYFVRKAAPVSRVESLMDCEAEWRVTRARDGVDVLGMRVAVPATSLCPCSKAISSYGAHNQRSLITIDARLHEPVEIDELVAIAERGASCAVYGLLKRPDEKFVTEMAYDNPKFAEDLVRDVALALERDARIDSYVVDVENFESIHNHSAFARISRPARSRA
jgi:GTP cyclohydrolase IB